MERTTDERITEIAQGMLKRYSSPKVALDMAWSHAMDHENGSFGYDHWKRVYEEIRRLSKAQR